MQAQEVMSAPVVTVERRTPIEAVVACLVEHQIAAVVVVDAQRRPVGMVSESDLLYRVAHLNLPPHIEILGSVIYLETPRRMEERLHKVSAVYAEDIMSAPVVTVSPDTPIESVASILIEKKVHRAAVVSSGALVGIVTRGDVVRHTLKQQWPGAFPQPAS